MKRTIICLGVVALTVWACSKSNEVTERGKSSGGNTGSNLPGNCDTVNMKFTANVLPILKANCYSCHGDGNSEGGVQMNTYAEVKNLVSNTSLIGVITHAPGYPPMPDGGVKLSDCNINMIQSWINRGANND